MIGPRQLIRRVDGPATGLLGVKVIVSVELTMLRWSLQILLLLACALAAHEASGQASQIFLDTTGDFGLDSNWSDPAKAPPAKPPGAGAEHAGYLYYINGSRTATISHDSPSGSHFEVFHIFPGDGPPSGPPTPGSLIFEGGPEPEPGEFGASLTVYGVNRFIVGQRCNDWQNGGDPFTGCGGGGQVIMNGSSDLLADGIVIGERDFGSLYIGPDARVRSGHLDGAGNLSAQDFRIGSFGPSRGLREPTPQLLEGEGYVEVHGTLVAHRLIMPESGATGHLKVMPGASVTLYGVDMAIQPTEASRSSTLEIVGSGGAFTTSNFVDASHPTATVKFTADASGVTPINAGSFADVEGGNLILGLDDFNFTPTSELTLIDAADFSLFGTFGNVTFEGDTTATVNYDEDGGRLFLNNFMSTEPPDLFGDYNDDGVVNAADYTVWRNSNGSNTTLPNDQSPGSVLPVDYDVWRAHFGKSRGGNSSAVPESASLAIAALVIAFGWTTTRCRRGNRASLCY
jgi:hypothetical protein